jgi:hypothetical protein
MTDRHSRIAWFGGPGIAAKIWDVIEKKRGEK